MSDHADTERYHSDVLYAAGTGGRGAHAAQAGAMAAYQYQDVLGRKCVRFVTRWESTTIWKERMG
jgi:hypothetical protein